jgi:uncharacterized protein (TIGR02147 family)
LGYWLKGFFPVIFMPMGKEEPTNSFNIFQYMEYSEILNAFYTIRKLNAGHFSWRAFAQRAGVSHSTLTDVISGRRNLSLKAAEKCAEAMGLKSRERSYLMTLVKFCNTSDQSLKNQLLGELLHMQKYSRGPSLQHDSYEYFSHWFYPLIRELVELDNFQEDYEKISRSLSSIVTVKPEEVKKAIVFLENRGFITRDNNGRFRQKDKVIHSGTGLSVLTIREYQRRMIELGAAAIHKIPREKREISSLTLNTSENSYQEILRKIRRCQEEILELVRSDKAPSIKAVQVNFQAFPLCDGFEK